MEDVKPFICPVCGGIDFIKQNGYFYCQECQTQCEDICEQVFEKHNENEAGDRLTGTPFVSKRATKREKPVRKGEDFTSWEMLNFVLHGQVEELLLIGAPPTLKETILQLWVFYLRKLEVAFFSKKERVLPKLGIKFNTEDAKMLFGLRKRKPIKERKAFSVNAVLNTTISGLTDWSSIQIKKKLLSKAKKALMVKESETSFMESESSICDRSSLLDTSQLDNSSNMLSISMTEPSASFSDSKFERSKAAMKRLSKSNKGEEANIADPMLLSRCKLVVLLYLALLFEGSKIHVSDLIRWIREGHFSYYEAAKHLPEFCFVQGRYSAMFALDREFPNYGVFVKTAGNLARFLEMKDWPTPDASELAKKYVKELHLPEMFCDLILRFMVLVPSAFDDRFHSGIPNYEGRILAILIVILKLLFGLDGKTEQRISKAASQLNQLVNRKKNSMSNKLFVWQDWVQMLMCRDAVLSKYHFPTKHLLCSEGYGNPYSYINFIKKWNVNNAGLLEKYNYLGDDVLRVIQPALMNTFTSILDKLEAPTSSEDQNICFPQCFTPYSLYIQMILEKCNEMEEPLIVESAVEILLQDFSKSDISYLISPQLLAKQVSAYGHGLKIKKKSAEKKFSKLPNEKKKYDQIRFTHKCFVAVLNNSEIHKGGEQIPNEVLLVEERKGKAKEKKSKRSSSVKYKKKIKKKRKLKTNCMKNSDEKADTLLSTKSRKRKKESILSENCKKIKFSKYFKLYVPCSKYWVRISDLEMREFEFETQIFHKFPLSFSWLLSECALISEMSKLTLFKEVLRIEKLCKTTFDKWIIF